MFWSRTHHAGNQCLCNCWYSGGAVLNRLQHLLEIFIHPGGREKEQHPSRRVPGVEKCVDRSARDCTKSPVVALTFFVPSVISRTPSSRYRLSSSRWWMCRGGPPAGGMIASMMKYPPLVWAPVIRKVYRSPGPQ